MLAVPRKGPPQRVTAVEPENPMKQYKVTALCLYTQRMRAVLVRASDERHAARRAMPLLRRLVPGGYSLAGVREA